MDSSFVSSIASRINKTQARQFLLATNNTRLLSNLQRLRPYASPHSFAGKSMTRDTRGHGPDLSERKLSGTVPLAPSQPLHHVASLRPLGTGSARQGFRQGPRHRRDAIVHASDRCTYWAVVPAGARPSPGCLPLPCAAAPQCVNPIPNLF